MKWAFFGTPELSVLALEAMATQGMKPSLVVCNPDAPVGRKQLLTPPPTKAWAESHQIPVFQPPHLKDKAILSPLTETDWDYFVVFAYGKIMPDWLLSLPRFGTINAHPSLLPKLRGASPIRSTLLHDLTAAGVTIIQMDAELDHGPILYQQPVVLKTPIPGREIDTILARMCGNLLVHVMQELPHGTLKITPQDHTKATFCTKITKDMAELKLDPYHLPSGDEALMLFRKICAFDGWPSAFFLYNGIRIKITKAELTSGGQLRLLQIVPAGKNEQDASQYFDRIADARR